MARRKQQTETPKASTKPADNQILIGTNILPAEIAISEGLSVQLGEIVAKAHERSGLSIEEWNALPEGERDALLLNEVEQVKSAALEAASNGPQAPLEPALKQDAQAGAKQTGKTASTTNVAEDEVERVFKTLSRVKRNGARYAAGDDISLDRAGFDELKRYGVFDCTFEDGTPVKA